MKDYMAEWKRNSIRIGAPTCIRLRSLHLSRIIPVQPLWLLAKA